VQFYGESGQLEIDQATFEEIADLIRERDGVPEEELETTNAGD